MSKLGQTNRLNQILIALLVVQIVLTAFVLRPKAAAPESGPLIPNFSANDVTALTVTDNEGNSVALAKKGEDWILPENGDFPAKAESITTLLDGVAGIKTDRLVTQTEDSHKRLQVAQADFNRRL